MQELKWILQETLCIISLILSKKYGGNSVVCQVYTEVFVVCREEHASDFSSCEEFLVLLAAVLH